MTNNVKFFDKQSEITNQKLEFYKNYIYNYSMKLLMWYWKLFIADLFCWCWYNWASKWSPLIVIDILNKVLTDKTLLRTKPNSEVILLLNDWEKKNMDELSDNLKSHPINEKIKIFTINEDFCWIINKVKWLKDFKTIPKFFFLDPFSYSTISLSNLRLLFDLWNSEVLMFSPIFDAYRFKTAKNILENEDHKTRKFIEEFTCDGLIDYSDIYEFNNSIKEKLRIELTTNYVKYILLEWWKRKNALFHLTNHISWSILFTKIARKLWDYWMWIDIKFKEKTKNQICLFEPHQLQWNQFIDAFEKILISELKKKKLSNLDILELTTIYWFEPKETTNILKKHKNNIEIEAMPNYSRWFYISEEAWKENIRCYINFKD